MGDLLGIAFGAAVFGIGSLGLGYMGWQLNAYGRRAGTLPRQVARLWKWRIVLGLCGSIVAFCFGCNALLVHHVGFNWVLISGAGAAAGLAGVLFMIENPESYRRSQRPTPGDDPTGDDTR